MRGNVDEGNYRMCACVCEKDARVHARKGVTDIRCLDLFNTRSLEVPTLSLGPAVHHDSFFDDRGRARAFGGRRSPNSFRRDVLGVNTCINQHFYENCQYH